MKTMNDLTGKSFGSSVLSSIIVCLLVLLWSYTSMSKMMDYELFERELNNQNAFKGVTSNLLATIIPVSELIVAALLLFPRTRKSGLTLSLFLMLVFTIYVGLVLLHYFDRVPCSCGGVLKQMGWSIHFWFNVFFTLLSTLGLWLEFKKTTFKI